MATEVDRHRLAAYTHTTSSTARSLHSSAAAAAAYTASPAAAAAAASANKNTAMSMSLSALSASSSSKNPLKPAVQIIEDRLYYMALKFKPPMEATYKRDCADGKKRLIQYFSVDNELVYWNFFLDFGPLNLGQLYRFCVKLNRKLTATQHSNTIVCFYSSHAPAKRANAVCLICCWQILYLNRSPEEAFWGFQSQQPQSHPAQSAQAQKDNLTTTTHANNNNTATTTTITTQSSSSLLFQQHHHHQPHHRQQQPKNASAPPLTTRANPTISPLPPFHDASPCACTYELTVMDCLRGLAKARMYGFFDFDNFDVEEYEHFEQVENGDLNWIIYGKIMAFAGPSYERRVSPEGYCTLSPADYIPYFKEKGVSLVVRLNRKAYNEEDFKRAGIDHLEQFYVDGSCPPIKILDRVVEAFESVPDDKAFAVHCKAGLGRTGTCIGAYIMKHYRFTASEVIAWMRICRPGCVIGPQQQFLREIEQRMWQLGAMEGTFNVGKKICAGLTFNCLGGAAARAADVASCHDDKATKDSSVAVVAGTNSYNEAIVGRAGQAEGLLGAHRRNRATATMSATVGSRKGKAPPSPETMRLTSKSKGVVTPDPPGKSSCDHWYI